MLSDLVIVGCGGFGREVADVVRDINRAEPTWNIVGFADDAPSNVDQDRVERLGLTVLGSIAEVLESQRPASFVVGIGNGVVRQRLSDTFGEAGWRPATLIHPTASVGSCTNVGAGSILCHGVVITTNVELGRSVHVNLNSTVGHDTVIGDFATVNPLVAISGNCRIDDFANLGSGATVLPGVHVGAGAVVGGGACVVREVPDATIVKGVPAR